MPRPVCAKCQIEMKCEKTGAALVEMTIHGPTAVWAADLYKCPVCGCEVVPPNAFAMQPAITIPSNIDGYLENYRHIPNARIIPFWINAQEKSRYQVPLASVTTAQHDDTEDQPTKEQA